MLEQEAADKPIKAKVTYETITEGTTALRIFDVEDCKAASLVSGKAKDAQKLAIAGKTTDKAEWDLTAIKAGLFDTNTLKVFCNEKKNKTSKHSKHFNSLAQRKGLRDPQECRGRHGECLKKGREDTPLNYIDLFQMGDLIGCCTMTVSKATESGAMEVGTSIGVFAIALIAQVLAKFA